MSRLTSCVEESYSGRVIIRAFNREEESLASMKEASEELGQNLHPAEFLAQAINPGPSAL